MEVFEHTNLIFDGTVVAVFKRLIEFRVRSRLFMYVTFLCL